MRNRKQAKSTPEINPIFIGIVDSILSQLEDFSGIPSEDYLSYYIGQFESKEDAVKHIYKDILNFIPESLQPFVSEDLFIQKLMNDYYMLQVNIDADCSVGEEESLYLVFNRPKN